MNFASDATELKETRRVARIHTALWLRPYNLVEATLQVKLDYNRAG
jgi:hypothetical protein